MQREIERSSNHQTAEDLEVQRMKEDRMAQTRELQEANLRGLDRLKGDGERHLERQRQGIRSSLAKASEAQTQKESLRRQEGNTEAALEAEHARLDNVDKVWGQVEAHQHS